MPTDKHFRTPEELEQAFEDYKMWVDENPRMVYQNTKNGVAPIPKQRPLTILGFAVFCKISAQTLYNYGDKDKPEYKEYFGTYTRIKQQIDNDQFEGGMVEQYNANLVSKKLGLIDKQEVKSEVTQKTVDLANCSEEELRKRLELVNKIESDE